jgi:pyruvate/2-oxoglutarate dehydrogenase complex dihydrolipoamide acyltransferase (E2) component
MFEKDALANRIERNLRVLRQRMGLSQKSVGAILAVSAIEDRPVVRDGQIVIRPIMPYSLTFDHRVIYGFGGEQFLRTIRRFMESASLLMF